MGDAKDKLKGPMVPSSSNAGPLEVSPECWRVAEAGGENVVCSVKPNEDSERLRWDIINYLRNLIGSQLGCEVLPFGSVPFKTYLPDGDYDMTTYASSSMTDYLPKCVLDLLQSEEKSEDAEYEVKDIIFISAEVKLVKCFVQNFIVDISFNQVGGISTLSFLERVNATIGKANLFKRSIILIKAWCFYESRILGAQFSLLSTYAVETLILYIFNFFHSSLDGPFSVLYRFLDYFGKFDWDRFCVSLHGPVLVSSLPDIVVEGPENHGDDCLFPNQFFNECKSIFESYPEVPVKTHHSFLIKYLNIFDPMKENNNLGRSVSKDLWSVKSFDSYVKTVSSMVKYKGNAYRIRSAFAYGAQKLAKIFLSPRGDMQIEVNRFFVNTLQRYGDVWNSHLQSQYSSSPDMIFNLGDVVSTWQNLTVSMACPTSDGSQRSICETVNDIDINNAYQGIESGHVLYHPQDFTNVRINAVPHGVVAGGRIINVRGFPYGTCMSIPMDSQFSPPMIFGSEQHQLHQANGPSQINISSHVLPSNLPALGQPNSMIPSFGPRLVNFEEADEGLIDASSAIDLPSLNGRPNVYDSTDHSREYLTYPSVAHQHPGNSLSWPHTHRNESFHSDSNDMQHAPHQSSTFQPKNGAIHRPPPPPPSRYQMNSGSSMASTVEESIARNRGTGTYLPVRNWKNKKPPHAVERNAYIVPPRHRIQRPETTGIESSAIDLDEKDDRSEHPMQPTTNYGEDVHGQLVLLDSPILSDKHPKDSIQEKPNSSELPNICSVSCIEHPEVSLHETPGFLASSSPFPTLPECLEAIVHISDPSEVSSLLASTSQEPPEIAVVASQLPCQTESESCKAVDVKMESKNVTENNGSGNSTASMVPSVVKHSPTNSSEKSMAQPYQLKDDKDFPPLSRCGPPKASKNFKKQETASKPRNKWSKQTA